MYQISVQLPFNGFHVKGKITLPVQANSLIIFSHGYGLSKLMVHEHRLALEFQQAGFGTLVLDLLDEHDELPIKYKDIDLLSKGLVTSTNWLSSHSEYRSLNLAYFGSGTGSAAAVNAASELGSIIKTIVSLSGRLNLCSKNLVKIKCPVLLLTGEMDFKTVNINQNAIKYLKPNKQLAIVPGASHMFEEADKLNEAANITLSWFKKHLSWDKSKASTF
ncbi:dienelactone hydrolase family protein [Fodinibius saliphilus]|uniref:dienelactone hydrolase family protein n=1 Tax=Fodinibius saliphilus TaxID=1920650 RepID=UPI001107CBB4|nr:alpha/beta hydrolase [Fodinibius saliphilus]